ncbi:hypothetical protein GCM10010449_10340 [Streptomyces rectiviolaceus]|uniref:Uncharacterized protein n=1 Tax=Streptomyces rectiviolaceus TaxID=332591 RepID=A0ABP6MAN4_9ACTN
MVLDVLGRYPGFRIVDRDSGGTLDVGPHGVRRCTPVARMLPCAPGPGTDILTFGIPLGSPWREQRGLPHGQSGGNHARGHVGTYGGNRGSNASLEGTTG